MKRQKVSRSEHDVTNIGEKEILLDTVKYRLFVKNCLSGAEDQYEREMT